LHDECEHQDYDEEWVVEEVLKNVYLFMLEFTGVNLVENLQKHEYIEEYRVMLSGLLIPVLHSNRRRNVQNFRS
jgi:hypothetical protein